MAISKISSSSIDPNVSLGDGFLKVDSTNNRVGIGTSNPNFDLDVSVGSLGTTNGDSLSAFRLHSTTGNNDYLNFSKIRESDGIYWNTAGWRIQQKVDSTDMGYIQFNGSDNVQGLSFGTANTERMRIDNSGRVTMPYQPAFQAYNPQGQFITGNTEAAFNSTYVNIGGHYNTSTGRFTAPIAGRYAFHFDGLFDNLNNHHISMRKNGIQFDGSEGYSDGTNVCISKSMVWNLAAGDYVSIFVDTTSSRIHQRYSSFCGYLLG